MENNIKEKLKDYNLWAKENDLPLLSEYEYNSLSLRRYELFIFQWLFKKVNEPIHLCLKDICAELKFPVSIFLGFVLFGMLVYFTHVRYIAEIKSQSINSTSVFESRFYKIDDLKLRKLIGYKCNYKEEGEYFDCYLGFGNLSFEDKKKMDKYFKEEE